MTHKDLLDTIRRLMPVLEKGLKQGLYSADDAATVEADMAKLRLELEPVLLTPPEGVDPKDTVTVLGVRVDGSRVVLGTVAMSPQSKLRALTREQFGHFSENDLSDATVAYFLGERVLALVLKEKPSLKASIVLARETVVSKLGDFRDDDCSTAADAFYITETLLKWMGIAHPDSFSPA